MTGYDFHPEAVIDLDEIWEFIARDNVEAADRVMADILGAIDTLVPFPHPGCRRPDLTSRPLRFILVREYLIAYDRMKSPCGLARWRGDPWTPQPSCDGRDPERQRMTLEVGLAEELASYGNRLLPMLIGPSLNPTIRKPPRKVAALKAAGCGRILSREGSSGCGCLPAIFRP